MEIYQTIYSKGKVVQEGVRECSQRYETLKKVFSRYNRPFSILDIGANFGYFSIRAAEDFGATAVMIQGPPQSKKVLRGLCEENGNLNLTVLSKRVSAEELHNLSKCERFDVVLALNVLHHIPNNWKLGCESVMDLGDTIIFENPPSNDKGTCGKKIIEPMWDYFNALEHEELGLFSRHTDPYAKSRMIELKGTNKPIEKAYWDVPEDKKFDGIIIESNFNTRQVIKKQTNESSNWINGVNLQTFLNLGGLYPSREEIRRKIQNKEIKSTYNWDDTHGDIAPWNFVLNGSDLHLIDLGGKNHLDKRRTDQEGINRTASLIQ